jgi:light-regulated signal transduction histidine kinase (bacteriophytochrome)
VGTNADDFTIVDLDEVREEVERNFKSSIISGILIIESEKLPAVRGVKTQLIQLFANIVSNAIKYNEAKVKKVVITKSENEKEWIITIADNGIGIDDKHRNDIYLLFKRLHPKSKYSGTGIGLAVCKKIIQRHQGKIWLEANPEGGSMFRFALPKTSFT